LLQGNIPSVMGGGETGNSWFAPITKETKQTPDKKINPNTKIVFFIFYLNGGEKGVKLLVRHGITPGLYRQIIRPTQVDTFDDAKPRFLNRGKKRRSVSTLSIPRASGRGVKWVDFQANGINFFSNIFNDKKQLF